MSNFQELTDEQLTMVSGGVLEEDVTQANFFAASQSNDIDISTIAKGGIAKSVWGSAFANAAATSTAKASNSISSTQSNVNK